MRDLMMAALLVLFSINGVASAVEDDILEVETEGSYRLDAGAPIRLAQEVAFFIGKRKAVDLAGRYLSHKSLIPVYELNRDEIYSLAAGEIRAELLEEKRETVEKYSIYHVRIRAWVQASDLIRAQREDAKQEEKETKESYQEEMQQTVSAKIDPGIDIAKAYRLIRKKKWRLAAIYLNHLGKKYPNWADIYVAKALVSYILHETVFMEKALKQACRLDHHVACDDLKHLKKVNEHDFGLSIPE
jgi:hypothetical protein